jgi:hypothetical protein
MQGAITHLIAGVPVSQLGAAIDWYTRLFGRAPDLRAGEEILWDIDEHATLFIEPDAARAGAGRVTLAVAGLDALLERLAAEGIEHAPIETALLRWSIVMAGDWSDDCTPHDLGLRRLPVPA